MYFLIQKNSLTILNSNCSYVTPFSIFKWEEKADFGVFLNKLTFMKSKTGHQEQNFNSLPSPTQYIQVALVRIKNNN